MEGFLPYVDISFEAQAKARSSKLKVTFSKPIKKNHNEKKRCVSYIFFIYRAAHQGWACASIKKSTFGGRIFTSVGGESSLWCNSRPKAEK